MIQTMNLDIMLKGRNLDMDPKAITKPKGTAPINVTKNNLSVCRKPLFNAPRTIGICSMIRSILLLFCFRFYASGLLHGPDMETNNKGFLIIFYTNPNRRCLYNNKKIIKFAEMVLQCRTYINQTNYS